MKNILVVFLICFLSGCASMEQSLIVGAGVGASGGAVTGYALHYNTKGMIFTTAVGTALGVGLGYLAHRIKEGFDSKDEKIASKIYEKNGKTPPILTVPKVNKVCVDDKVEGNRFIENHCIYVIEEPSVFTY